MEFRVCRFHAWTVIYERFACLLISHLQLLILLQPLILYLMGLSVSQSSASKMKKEAGVVQTKTSPLQDHQPPAIPPEKSNSIVQPIILHDSETRMNGPKQTSMKIHPEQEILSVGSSIINLSSKKTLNEIKQMKILEENMVSVDRIEVKLPSRIIRKKDESRISEEDGGVEMKIKQYVLQSNTRESICGSSNTQGKTRRQLMKDVAEGRRDTMQDPFLNCLTCSRPDFEIGNPLSRYKPN